MLSRRSFLSLPPALAASSLLPACVGSTGGELLTFRAYARGARDAEKGRPYAFVSSRGWAVTLTRAKLHVGAMYLNKARPTSVSSETACTLAGIYVAEVPGPLDVDLLDPSLQRFSVDGFATTDFAPTGEVWLVGEDVNAIDDPTVILDVAGTASKDGAAYPFEGALTIGRNRLPASSDPATPGATPICKERIVSPIETAIRPAPGGSLVLAVAPSRLFANVDFSRLAFDGAVYRFDDEGADQPSKNLFSGLRSAGDVYAFEWTSAAEVGS
jgi:hypothetical protein